MLLCLPAEINFKIIPAKSLRIAGIKYSVFSSNLWSIPFSLSPLVPLSGIMWDCPRVQQLRFTLTFSWNACVCVCVGVQGEWQTWNGLEINLCLLFGAFCWKCAAIIIWKINCLQFLLYCHVCVCVCVHSMSMSAPWRENWSHGQFAYFRWHTKSEVTPR